MMIRSDILTVSGGVCHKEGYATRRERGHYMTILVLIRSSWCGQASPGSGFRVFFSLGPHQSSPLIIAAGCSP